MKLSDITEQLRADSETLKAETEEPDDSTEEELTEALSLLEDCGKFLDVVRVGMKLTKEAKLQVEDLCEEIYSYLGQYEDVEEEDNETS